MKKRFEWEILTEYIDDGLRAYFMRAKIPGGWLVYRTKSVPGVLAEGVCFVPDPEHKWDGQTLE